MKSRLIEQCAICKEQKMGRYINPYGKFDTLICDDCIKSANNETKHLKLKNIYRIGGKFN